jgi:hypothetical protein
MITDDFVRRVKLSIIFDYLHEKSYSTYDYFKSIIWFIKQETITKYLYPKDYELYLQVWDVFQNPEKLNLK